MNQRTLAAAALIIVAITATATYLLFQRPPTEAPPTGDVKQFALTARRWEFNQTRLEVNAGDTVILEIKGLDDGSGSGHGFGISKFNVDHVIQDGKTATIQFVATYRGTFTFFCSVPCGSGHNGMRGTLVVS